MDVLALGSGPDVARRARAFLRQAVPGAAATVLADAELVVTELVTNAQLHGLAPVSVRASLDGESVRVEVQDAGRRLPVLPVQSAEAMTGRGLSLVTALSSRWGVVPDPAHGGKTVWAEVGSAARDLLDAELDVDALLAAWPQDVDAEELFEVRLGSVPTDLLLDAKRHIDNVVRELTLEGAVERAGERGLQALVETVTQDFAGARSAIKRQAIEAAGRGDDETDLVLRLPASAADAGERYLDALTEADRLSRGARLLTLETPPVHRVFRRWYVQSLVDQLRALSAGRSAPRTRPFVSVLADEVTSLSALRETADRLSLLQRVNSDLTDARTVQDIAAVVTQHATRSLGAQAAMVFLAEGGVLRSVHAERSDPRWVREYAEIPLDADLPGPVVYATGTPLLVRKVSQLVERWPALSQVYDSERVLHVAPLVVGDQRIGVLSLSFLPAGELDEDTQTRFVQALADALAQALQRARAMEQAAAGAERLAFLADASVALTASLDVQQTIDAVTGLLVPRLADWCTVVLLEGDELVTVGIAHTDPDKVAWCWELVRAYPSRTDSPHGDGNVLRTGVSELHSDLPDAVVAAAAVDEEHLRLLRELGMRSVLAVPLPGRDGVIGVLSVICAESGRRYTESDVGYLEDVARRAGLALETARVLRDRAQGRREPDVGAGTG